MQGKTPKREMESKSIWKRLLLPTMLTVTMGSAYLGLVPSHRTHRTHPHEVALKTRPAASTDAGHVKILTNVVTGSKSGFHTLGLERVPSPLRQNRA